MICGVVTANVAHDDDCLLVNVMSSRPQSHSYTCREIYGSVGTVCLRACVRARVCAHARARADHIIEVVNRAAVAVVVWSLGWYERSAV